MDWKNFMASTLLEIDNRVSQRERERERERAEEKQFPPSPIKFSENNRFFVAQTKGVLFSDCHLYTTEIFAGKPDFS